MGNTRSSNLSFKIIYNKDEAQELLNLADEKDNYIKSCNNDRNNMISRRQCTYSANHMTTKEYKFFQIITENAQNKIPLRLQMDLNEVLFIQLMPTADGGMPHTRPYDIICYPDISKFFTVSTLIHELWHIHQRNYKQLWDQVFESLYWTKWNGKLPLDLERNRRYNPDTIDTPFYVFKEKWVPIPVFEEVKNPKITNVYIWYYNIITKQHTRNIPQEIMEYFPNVPSSGYEHPREITAYMLSQPNDYQDSPGFNDLIKAIGQMAVTTSK
jgi:hypothetical protein